MSAALPIAPFICEHCLLVASIFDESCYGRASVDIRPLPGAWVAELLGVILGVQDR